MPTMKADDGEDVALVMSVVDHEVAGQVHHRDHPGEARDRDERLEDADGGGSPRGAAGGSGASVASSSLNACAIVRGSGRTSRTSTRPTAMIPPAASHGTTRASVSSSFPAKSGRKTSGPSAAPKSAEEDEGDPARAARRREHVCGRGAGEQHGSLRAADQREPDHHERGGLDLRSRRRCHGRGSRSRSRPRAPGRGRPVHQPSRRERSERSGCEEDRRAEAQDPLDTGDEHERHRRDSDRQLNHPREARQRGREEDHVAQIRARSPAEPTGGRPRDPRGTQRRRRCDGWRTNGPPRRSWASRPTRSCACRWSARPETVGLRRSRGGSVDDSKTRCRDGSGRGSRATPRPVAEPRGAVAIVAVPPAGPRPVSCRSEVSGMPEHPRTPIAGASATTSSRASAFAAR